MFHADTDELTDMTKLIAALRGFANAPKIMEPTSIEYITS